MVRLRCCLELILRGISVYLIGQVRRQSLGIFVQSPWFRSDSGIVGEIKLCCFYQCLVHWCGCVANSELTAAFKDAISICQFSLLLHRYDCFCVVRSYLFRAFSC